MAKKAEKKLDVTLEELLEAGVHFGHQSRRWNPKMAPYIYGEREGVHIFDLAKTREALLEALTAITEVSSSGGIILFVGTKRQVADLVRQTAQKAGMPYVNRRWLGGTLSNFEQIKKSVKKLFEMKEKREEPGYKKEYTKRERLLFDREIVKLERMFGGIASLTKVPDMLFVIDTNREKTAVKEAERIGIPVAAIVDTNSNPDNIAYPIPGNDDAVKAVSLIIGLVGKAIGSSKAQIEV